MKILVGILIIVAILSYYFFKEMKNDYNKDLEYFKNNNNND